MALDRIRRLMGLLFAGAIGLGMVPVAAAHGGHVTVGGVHLSQWYALIPLVLGIAIVITSAFLPRVLRPEYAHHALSGVLVGLAVAVIGGIGLVQLAPYEWFSAQPLIPRAIHERLMFLIGFWIALSGVIVSYVRWPERPRYAGLSALAGLWIAYPGLSAVGIYTPTHPLGYLIVLGLPIAIGYVLHRDARGVLEQVREDRRAQRFGASVGLLAIVFFLFSAGMVTLIPEQGIGFSLTHGFIESVPVQAPLVLWPAVEVFIPQIPFFGMISIGTAILMGVLGGLIGLNAALFALGWGQSSCSELSGSRSQTTAGIAGIAAPQTCCCCGPLFSQLAVVTLGPSAAGPIYLLFADPSSSIGSVFFAASVLLLTGTLVHAAGNARLTA